MNNIEDVEGCTGCTACMNLCPKRCISMKENKEGFLFPHIDEERCINCGVCYKNCPQVKKPNFNEVSRTYAAINNNHDVVMNSSSGGLVSAIADIILESGGVVYGVTLNTNNWSAEYVEIDNKEDLKKIRGSKYLQSSLEYTFTQIQKRLDNKYKVLFIGTPCQVAGLYAYFEKKNIDDLYTIDLVCHGVPSPKLFKVYTEYLETKYHKRLTGFSFRDKKRFPNKLALKYTFGADKRYYLGKCEAYYMQFNAAASYRESCYKCQYAQRNRVGDITLADYWGIEMIHKDFDNTYGSSLVLENTNKGKWLIEQADIYKIDSKLEWAVKYNHNLSAPSAKNSCREMFYKEVDEIGIENTIKKYIKVKSPVYNFILTHLPSAIINMLAKVKR